jgi:uncharacterized protein
MKKLIFLLAVVIIIPLSLSAQSSKPSAADTPAEEMKIYTIVFLKKGPKRDQAKEVAAKIQEGHLAYISQMAEMGVLSMAGPFMDEGDIRGILIFNVQEEEEVRHLVSEDPAVKAGRLIFELHKWYTKKGVTLN